MIARSIRSDGINLWGLLSSLATVAFQVLVH
jgi:hypothetical protein